MKWFADLRLRPKLLLSFGFVLTLFAGTGLFAVRQLSVVNDQVTIIADGWLPRVRQASAIQTYAALIRTAQFRYVAATDSAGKAGAEQTMAERRARLAETRRKYEPLISTARERQIYERFAAQWEAHEARWAEARTHARAGRADSALALMTGASLAEFTELNGTLQGLLDLNEAGAAAASERGNKLYASARRAIVTALGAGWSSAWCWRCSSPAASPRRSGSSRSGRIRCRRSASAGLRDALGAMAKGDLDVAVVPKTRPIRSTDGDEVGDLSRTVDAIIQMAQATVASFSEMQGTVRALVGRDPRADHRPPRPGCSIGAVTPRGSRAPTATWWRASTRRSTRWRRRSPRRARCWAAWPTATSRRA
jgi:hypothetical protein